MDERASSIALAYPMPAAAHAALPPIRDYHLWASEQAALIRAGRFDQIDRLNVADEIESLGKSEFRSVVSALEQILLHMLKWDHQPERRSKSWVHSIAVHRQHLADDLKDSPSLQSRLEEAAERAYRYARLGAAKETNLALELFPDLSPYSWQQIIEAPYQIDRD